MRANSSPIRSSRESLDPDASLPDDEANGVSSTHCCDSDVDERIVRHKKRHCLETMEIDIDRRGSVEPINLDACIVCEISDNRVSHCSGIDCLLSFHGECLYADLGSSSEHLANPYCPYCWFKILALKSNSLREKTIGAKNALCKYLDTKLSGDENGNQEHSMDTATENFQDDEDNETAKDQTEVSKGEGNKGDVSLFSSMQESCSGKEQDQVQQNEKERGGRRLIEFERNEEDVIEQITSLAQVTKVVVANPNTVSGEICSTRKEEHAMEENSGNGREDVLRKSTLILTLLIMYVINSVRLILETKPDFELYFGCIIRIFLVV